MIKRRYPFCRDYEIWAPKEGDRAHTPPPSMVAIYTDQLEAGLRIPTSSFICSNMRYWATRITQLTPNTIWVLIDFELICHLHEINPSVTLFQCFYTIKKHGNNRWWFYFSSRHGCPKLIDDMLTSIKHWKERFVFVSEGDFPRGYWWRSINAPSDSTPGTLEHHNFEKIRKWYSFGNTLNGWYYSEAVLVKIGLSWMWIHPKRLVYYSS